MTMLCIDIHSYIQKQTKKKKWDAKSPAILFSETGYKILCGQ